VSILPIKRLRRYLVKLKRKENRPATSPNLGIELKLFAILRRFLSETTLSTNFKRHP
jgi:hypothetical protein